MCELEICTVLEFLGFLRLNTPFAHNVFKLVILYLTHIVLKGVAKGERGKSPPPRNRKNCYRKMVVFPKALFLVTNFRKNVKNQNKKFNFSIAFSSKNFKISQQFVFFVKMRKKLTHRLLTYLKNMQK